VLSYNALGLDLDNGEKPLCPTANCGFDSHISPRTSQGQVAIAVNTKAHVTGFHVTLQGKNRTVFMVAAGPCHRIVFML
jgi:hypothetical protein